MEPVTIRARDGLALVSYLSRPRGTSPADRLPMVLLVHGGPWAHDNWGFIPTSSCWLIAAMRCSASITAARPDTARRSQRRQPRVGPQDARRPDRRRRLGHRRRHRRSGRVAIMGEATAAIRRSSGVTFTPEKFALRGRPGSASPTSMTFINTVPEYWQTWKSILAVRVGDYKTEEGSKAARGAPHRSIGPIASCVRS